jgi:hypothetical protein
MAEESGGDNLQINDCQRPPPPMFFCNLPSRKKILCAPHAQGARWAPPRGRSRLVGECPAPVHHSRSAPARTRRDDTVRCSFGAIRILSEISVVVPIPGQKKSSPRNSKSSSDHTLVLLQSINLHPPIAIPLLISNAQANPKGLIRHKRKSKIHPWSTKPLTPTGAHQHSFFFEIERGLFIQGVQSTPRI